MLSALQAQIIYNFGTSAGTNLPTSDTIDHVSAGAVTYANTQGTVGYSNTAAYVSSGYTGASGGYGYYTSGFNSGTTVNTLSSGYFSLTVTPETGYDLTITSISLGYRTIKVNEAPTTITLYSSVDNYQTALSSFTLTQNGNWHLLNSWLTSSLTDNEAITLRFYLTGTNGSTNLGSFRIDDLTIGASAVPEPVAASLILVGLCLIAGIRRKIKTSSFCPLLLKCGS